MRFPVLRNLFFHWCVKDLNGHPLLTLIAFLFSPHASAAYIVIAQRSLSSVFEHILDLNIKILLNHNDNMIKCLW